MGVNRARGGELVPSIGDDILSALEAVATDSVEVLAGILTTFDTARQAIRTVAQIVAAAATQSTLNTTLAQYQDVPLSPAVLADMSIRNLTIPSDAAGLDPGLVAEAAFSGIDPARFAAMALDTGESYGIDQALSLWWNSQFLVDTVPNSDTSVGAANYMAGAPLAQTYGITEAELDKVIYYSRVRDEFIPDLKRLPWSTMSKADAVETAVKGKATVELAKSLFVAAGGIPEQWDLLYQAAGDSIGIEKAVELHAHGNISDEELAAVIYQSRINPSFYEVAKLSNIKWLAPYQLEKLIAGGIVDQATATTWMTENGYPLEQAAAFVAQAVAGTTSSVKAETQGMIITEYEAQIITKEEATAALKSLGYTDAAVPFILESVEARRVLTMRNAEVTRLRQGYVEFLIPEQDVQTYLGQLGISQAAIDQFLTAWTIEQKTNVRRLSAAQVGKLTEDGVISANNAVTRWTQMGYLPEEAQLLLYIYQPPAATSPPATNPVTTVPPSGETVA